MFKKIIPFIVLCSFSSLVQAAFAPPQSFHVRLYDSVGAGSQISVDKFDTQGGTRRLTRIYLSLDTDQRSELMLENLGSAAGYAVTHLDWELSLMAGAGIELQKTTFRNGGIRFDLAGVGDTNGSSWLSASIPGGVRLQLDSQSNTILDLFSGNGKLNVWFQGNNLSRVVTSSPDIRYWLGDGPSQGFWALNYQFEQVPVSVSSPASFGLISLALLLLLGRRAGSKRAAA